MAVLIELEAAAQVIAVDGDRRRADDRIIDMEPEPGIGCCLQNIPDDRHPENQYSFDCL